MSHANNTIIKNKAGLLNLAKNSEMYQERVNVHFPFNETVLN